MNQTSNEFFVLRNQLDEETRCKLRDQVRESETDRVYVVEWTDDGERIVGLGCDVHGRTAKLPLDVQPGLFAVSSNVGLLRRIVSLYGYRLLVYPEFRYRCNNFSPVDLLFDYERTVNSPCLLVKIVTATVKDATTIYQRLKRNERAYRYVSVSNYWTVTLQVVFERMIKHREESRGREPFSFALPRVTMRWFDSRLNWYRYADPEIPVITFDIETVSTDPNRVPTGEHEFDELFTVSIHYNHTNVLYTLIYLPLRDQDPDSMTRSIRRDRYPEYADFENRLEVFASELELLTRTMRLLDLGRMHYLVGYNSLSYDIKYLFLRCAFYGLDDAFHRFVYRDGYAFGFDQIHLDLFRIIVTQYKFKQYGLNEVAKQLLKDTKTGVSAVALRYTFHAIRRDQRYPEHDECQRRSFPSIRDTLHYNNYDTVLVSKLLRKTRSIEFTLNQAHECRIPLSTLNTNYNKMRYKLWSKTFVVGLEIGLFQTTFKSPRVPVRLPLGTDDAIEARLNLEDQLLNGGGGSNEPRRNAIEQRGAKYPGGANFCLGECSVDDIQMLDYRIAYPLVIDRKNVSDETATILPADVILQLAATFTEERRAEFHLYDYLTHTGANKSETNILYHQYIYDRTYCGGEFPFTDPELMKRGNSPVVLIWEGRRGILSDIITRFNTIREETKSKRKTVESVLSLLEEKMTELAEEKRQIESLRRQQDNDNYDDDQYREENFETDKDGCFGADEYGDFGGATNETFGTVHDDEDGNFGAVENDDDDGDFGATDGDFGATDEDEGDFGAADGDFGATGDDEGDFGAVENDGNDEADGDFGATENDDRREGAASDGDFGSNDINDENNESDVASKRVKLDDRNPFGFSFVNRYIAVYENKSCVLDESALRELTYDEQLRVLDEIKTEASLELEKYANSYVLQKSLVASIYGCIGTSSPVCAALVTNAIRSTLLQAAQWVVSQGYRVYYIDTDSLFIKHPRHAVDPSPELNRMFPHTEIEMKPYRRCMFVQKKTYYTIEDDGSLKYFQHTNGSKAWKDFVQYVYTESQKTVTNRDIYQLFRTFYERVYDKLQSFDSFDSNLLPLVSQEVKIKSHYKTNTHLSKLRDYLRANYPALAGSYKQTVYYDMDVDAKTVRFRPVIDLTDVKRQLPTINMFKYYQNVFKTVYNVIKFHVKRNNEPFVVTLAMKPVLTSMITAFLDAHRERFPESHIDGGTLDRASSLALEDYAIEEDLQDSDLYPSGQ